MSTIPSHLQTSQCPPARPLAFSAVQPPTIRLYPLSNYTFGTKETQPEEDPSVKDRLKRLEEHYEQPGDYLAPEADEREGFKARLNERLAPPANSSLASTDPEESDWDIMDTLAQWWRPNFETFMYPYLPPHVSRPKELKKLYFIQLPKSKVLSVPKNMKLLAVPLFELYDNTGRYGPQLSAIPHYLSRYRWEFVDEQGDIVAWTPGVDVDPNVKTKVLAGGDDSGDGMNGVEHQVDANAEQGTSAAEEA
nr:pre-mrna cleavage factor im 25 kda subunit 2 [Quercus suber]POE87646.1 pre-mrna cleavage factor im 25 kda subunit 2 [Quercus suber]